MTVQTVGWVLDNSASRGYARLVLISLANHANKLGADCHPGLGTIAREAGIARSTASDQISRLESDGEILVHRRIGRGNENAYVLTMGRDPISCMDLFEYPEGAGEGGPHGPTKRPPAGHLGKGKRPPAGHLDDLNVRKMSEKCPAPRAAHVLIRPSDSIEPQTTEPNEREGAGAPARRSLSQVPDRNGLHLSDDDLAFAVAAGVPADRVEQETTKFLAYYADRQLRRGDWTKTWRSWMSRYRDYGPAAGRSVNGATRLDQAKSSLDRMLELTGRVKP